MQPQKDREFWDKEWESSAAMGPERPDARTWHNETHERLLDFLRPYLPTSGGKVAEVGCGSGRLLARIGREVTAELVAVDYSNAAMELVEQSAQTFGVKIQFVQADVNCMEFADHTFDLILSGGLLEHFEDPKPALAEMVRILKPEGVLMGAVVPRKIFSLHRPLHRLLGPKVFRASFGPQQYAAWLKDLGCVDIVTESQGFFPPLFHNLPASPRRVIAGVFTPFNGTWLADKLGYYFVFAGRRRA